MNNELPTDLKEIESLLLNYMPSNLDEDQLDAFADQMIAASEEIQPELEELAKLEKNLESLTPSTMRTDVVARMVKAMDSWEDQVTEQDKVLHFSNAIDRNQNKKSGNRFSMFAAAAAVAVLGAITALMLPAITSPNSVAPIAEKASENLDSNLQTISAPRAWVVPEESTQRIVNSQDRGVFYTPNKGSLQCLQVDKIKTIKLLDEEGREIIIEQPHREVILMPIETN